jgi:hypothetical protein
MATKKQRRKRPAVVRTLKRSSQRTQLVWKFSCPQDCKTLTVVVEAGNATPKSLTVFV